MVEINGIPIKNLNLTHKKKGDLIYYEGPLLAHYLGDDEREYLLKWVDADDLVNRWMAFPVTQSQLYFFLKKKISLKQLILQVKPNLVYFLELDNNLQINKLTAQLIEKIPVDYLPPQDSFYSKKYYEEYAQHLLESLRKKELTLKNKPYDIQPPMLEVMKEPKSQKENRQ